MQTVFYSDGIWKPRFRFKRVDDVPCAWDADWYYHPDMIAVEWFDVSVLEETIEYRLPPKRTVTNHSAWLQQLLRRVGLEYQQGKTMIRIFGYSPKSYDLLDL